MFKKFRFQVPAASLAIVMAWGPSVAHSRAVHCTNCATSSQAAAINAQLQSANVQLGRLVAAVQGASAANTTAQEGAARIMAEANVQTAREMEMARSVIRNRPLDPCGATAMVNGVTGGPGDVARDRGRTVGRGAPVPSGGGSPALERSLEISAGTRAAPAPEVGAALSAMAACESFAQGGQRAEICQRAGFNRHTSANPHPNADIRATTLFDGPQTHASRVVRRLTVEAESTADVAQRAFLRNLDTPVDLRALTAPELRTDAGRNYMALRDAYEARISVAMKPAEDQMVMMRANPNTRPIVEQLLQSQDGSFVQQYLQGAFPQFRQQGISLLELINLEAERRYRNPDWAPRIQEATQEQLLREQVQMQALQIWMTAQMLERLQQMAIVQGTATAVLVRQEQVPQLVEAHRAAQR
jgi:hypothetical protein